MVDNKLDDGFVEVPLDEGFEEVALAPIAAKRPQDMTPAEIEEADRLHQVEQGGQDIKAFGTGLLQGGTFGLSDEIGGGLDAGADALTGKAGLNDLYSKYRQYQQSREAANKQLEEESPMSYMAGEIGGTLATAALTPTLGGAKLATSAGRFAPRLSALMAHAANASTGAKILGAGTKLAIEGAPAGAAYGFGMSEHNIEQPTELALDVASGIGMGSAGGMALGAGMQGGKEAFKAAGKFANDSDFLRQVKVAYDYGKKGLNLGSSEIQDKISLIPGQRAEDLVHRLNGVDEQLGKQVGDALNNAQSAGVKVNIDPQLQATSQNIFNNLFVENPTLAQLLDPKSTKTLKLIAQQGGGDLSPIEARALKDELYGLTQKLSGSNTDGAIVAKQSAMQLASALDMAIKTAVPEYKAAAAHFESFRRMVPETILSKGDPSAFNQMYVGSLKNPDLKVYDASLDMLKGAKRPGESGAQARATFEKLRRNLGELKRINPKADAALGGGDKLATKLKGHADEASMLRQATGFDPQEGVTGVGRGAIGGLATTGRGLSMSGANKAGIALKTVGQSAPVKASVKLFEQSNDRLLNLADQLKSSPATEHMGSVLENALNNKNDVAKNAVLYKLLQNPDYRNMLNFGDDNE